MKRLLVVSLVLASAVGCASRRYETDKDDPHYQAGTLYPTTVPVQNSGYSGGEAGVGIVASAIALAANRDYYKATAITGKTLCRDAAGENLALPCGSVTVILLDAEGKVAAKSETSGGEFAFRVHPRATYHLEVEAGHYRLDKRKPERDYQVGDDVILHLVRNK